MEQHLHNWLHTPSAYDVLFVRWVCQTLPTRCTVHYPQHSTAQQTPQLAACAAHSGFRALSPACLMVPTTSRHRQRRCSIDATACHAVPNTPDVPQRRYEHMFDLPVAHSMFDHLCTAAPAARQAAASSTSSRNAPCSQLDPQQLAATFAALKRQRASRVTYEQRQKLYVQLVDRMDALPPIFLRTADCQVQPLVATTPSTAAHTDQVNQQH
jgi:hypothetical protein